MANNLIPEELDALIQQYLTDGILTDKERQVILKKAEALGLDRDEIDLYLDAEEQKIDQATDAAVRKQKGKTCPYCGAPIPQLTDKCPVCNQFITPQASEELKEIIDNLEEALVDLKAGKNIAQSKATVERYARKAKMYFSNNPKIKPLLAEIEIEMAEAEQKAIRTKRAETAKSFMSNRWTWFGVELISLIILFAILFPSIAASSSIRSVREERFIWAFLFLGIPAVILLVCTAKWAAKQGKEDKKEDDE